MEVLLIGGGGGAAVVDRFAPTIIVGNVLAGDPPAAAAAPFQYFGDPGTGTGIAAALAAAPVGGCWIHVRRGTYTLDAAVLPLSIPAGCKLTGDGVSTILVGRATDRRVFLYAGDAVDLSAMRIDLPAAAAGASGSHVIDASTASSRLTNIFVQGPGDGSDIDETLLSIVRAGGGGLIQHLRVADAPRSQNASVAIVRVRGASVGAQVLECDLDGGDYQILTDAGPAATDVRIVGNRCVGAGGGNSTACISVGGGARQMVRGNTCLGAVNGIYYDAVGGQVAENIIEPAGEGLASIVLAVNSGNVICTSNNLGAGGFVSDLGTGSVLGHNAAS